MEKRCYDKEMVAALMIVSARTVDEFFDGSPSGRAIFDAIAGRIGSFGNVEMRVSKCQIAFRHHRGFAYVWLPGRYVRSAVPAVLSIVLPERLDSPRFKSVVHLAPGKWMHHLELRKPAQIDGEVAGWLRSAYLATFTSGGNTLRPKVIR